MTTFHDLGDVLAEGDELDPTRPDYESAAAAPEFVAGGIGSSGDVTADLSADDEPALDNDGWSPAQGFCPKDGLLRVWVDEDVHLTRVRISPNWRERGKGATIETLFDRAMHLARLAYARRPNPIMQPPPFPASRTRPLSQELLAEVNERQAQVRDQLRELDARGGGEPGRWEGDGATGRSVNGKCTVQLGALGETTSVRFDDAWLDAASALQIADALVSAHKDAYQKLEEPRYVPGEREQLAYRMLEIREELQAAWRRGLK